MYLSLYRNKQLDTFINNNRVYSIPTTFLSEKLFISVEWLILRCTFIKMFLAVPKNSTAVIATFRFIQRDLSASPSREWDTEELESAIISVHKFLSISFHDSLLHCWFVKLFKTNFSPGYLFNRYYQDDLKRWLIIEFCNLTIETLLYK